MNTNTRRTCATFCLLSGLGLLVVGTRASAFESDFTQSVHAPPTPPPLFPFSNVGFGVRGVYGDASVFEFNQPPPTSANGDLRYVFHVIHEAHGGLAGFGLAPPVLPGLYICPDSVRQGSIAGCTPLTRQDAQTQTYPWLKTRRSWNSANSEHWMITKAAASIAGLPDALGKPFFLRYPGKNALIASPRAGSSTSFVVGQSQVPTTFNAMSAEVLRGISLYELAQVPDESFSVTDWVGGNEVCPLSDIDGAFAPAAGSASDDPGQLSCHDYLMALATLNVGHFAPGSRGMYEYYHDLALSRIRQCKSDLSFIPQFYRHTGDWEPVSSANDTELHECEREAFTYEMFAQHFMQDAWATGHMWHAWGHAQLSEYSPVINTIPDVVSDTPTPPAENLQGRRALIAMMTGAFRGMIHGDKSVVTRLLKDGSLLREWPTVQWILNQSPLLNGALSDLAEDPLSAPTYLPSFLSAPVDDPSLTKPVNVSWHNSSGLIAPGAGDDYANLVLTEGSNGSDTYAEQRNRLLMCTAKSMRDVYDAGPQAHGVAGVFSGAFPFDSFDIGTQCWDQRATNASMYGSVAPVRISYEPFLFGKDAEQLFGIANKAVLAEKAGAVQLPNLNDKTAFISLLTKRATLDAVRVTLDYAWNVLLDEEGIDSATGSRLVEQNGDPEISFLGVPPGKPLTSTPPLPYSDTPTPTVAESVSPQPYFTQRMFWRAHIADVCADDNLLQTLRDQCVAGASQPGGNPDACTACTEIAELHMPTAWADEIKQAGGLGPSKCAYLGFPGGGGLPEAYLNNSERVQIPPTPVAPLRDDLNAVDFPPYFLAFGYCTGTIPNNNQALGKTSLNDRGGRLWQRASFTQSKQQTVECSPNVTYFGSDPRFFGQTQNRVAVGLTESSMTAIQGWPNFDQVWIPPVINTLDETETKTLLNQPLYCGRTDFIEGTYGWRQDRSTDFIAQNSLGNAPFWDSQADGLPALPKFAEQESVDQLRFGVCGLAQRVSYHNQTCATALNGIHRPELLSIADAGYQVDTGAQVISSNAGPGQPRCSVREPRDVIQCVAGDCNADGLCSSVGKPKVTVFHPAAP